MSQLAPAFTIGVEEEYLLVDRASRDLVVDPPQELFAECVERTQGRATSEFLRCQLEIRTPVCRSVVQLRGELIAARRAVIAVCERYGIAPVAASTHPFAHGRQQRTTDHERYAEIAREVQAGVRRMAICGMHVHVGVEDDEVRIDLLNQLTYFLPHMLALSCSSPFWEGEDTGFKSFRSSLLTSLPRTGLPERFVSYGEYRRHTESLLRNGLIEDLSKIWWDARPSARYPTLETRVFDCATHIDDAMCLAALNLCLLRALYRLRSNNQSWRHYPALLIAENRWRAMRYSFDAGLLDLAKGDLVPFGVLLDEWLEFVMPDAEAVGCVSEIHHARTIVQRGTSAHQQLATYQGAIVHGATANEAARAVVDQLVRATAVLA
jgi:glutamate---cysteine ligase / carboxylate-amine ligase